MEFQDIRTSMGRAITHGDLFARFYDIFLASNPKIKSMFVGTNLETQKALLRQGVNLALMFAEGKAIGKSAMNRLRDSHSKSHLGIEPSMYRYWLDSFIKALKEFDPDFDAALEKQWRQALGVAIEHIAGGYNEEDSQTTQKVS
ncbi:MAG: globin [Gammaproteobacteria bacterium]|nr:globin [Gammaproteobacteria bacterium]